MTDSQRFFKTLKGVLTKNKRGFTAKNERGCRLKAKNNRFRSLLLILPLSVASMRRKMLKTTYTEEGSVTTIQSQKVAIYNSDRYFQTNHSDITTYSHRLLFDAFIYN